MKKRVIFFIVLTIAAIAASVCTAYAFRPTQMNIVDQEIATIQKRYNKEVDMDTIYYGDHCYRLFWRNSRELNQRVVDIEVPKDSKVVFLLNDGKTMIEAKEDQTRYLEGFVDSSTFEKKHGNYKGSYAFQQEFNGADHAYCILADDARFSSAWIVTETSISPIWRAPDYVQPE